MGVVVEVRRTETSRGSVLVDSGVSTARSCHSGSFEGSVLLGSLHTPCRARCTGACRGTELTLHPSLGSGERPWASVPAPSFSACHNPAQPSSPYLVGLIDAMGFQY